MKKLSIVIAVLLCTYSVAFAVPVLQVGVRDGSGGWVQNGPNPLSNPTESDTAVTSGSSIAVAAVYGGNLLIGGQYMSNDDWSDLSPQNGANGTPFPTDFNGSGAILVASVPDGSRAAALGALKVQGNFAIYSDADNSLLPNPPSNHDPAKGNIADFLFFDLGNFDMTANETVPDFQGTGSALGDIMDLSLMGMDGLAWLHFDIMAIVTDIQGQSTIVSNVDGNPGSHDVTWKNPGGGGGGGGQEIPVPEPSTLILVGAGIVGLAFARRKK